MDEHKKNEEAYNCSLTSVTDDLFVPSALPPEANTHSSYQVNLQKEVKSTQKQPSCKKGAAHAKKRQHEKVVKSKVSPEVAVMVG